MLKHCHSLKKTQLNVKTLPQLETQLELEIGDSIANSDILATLGVGEALEAKLLLSTNILN